MTANPVDLIGGLANTSNVVKADISAWAKARVPQVFANAAEVRNTTLVNQLAIELKSTGVTYIQDAADTTTVDDGVNCIVSLDGFRYKSNGSVVTLTGSQVLTNKSIDAALNTITNLSTAMFAANVVDTDGTFAANSDTRIASQKAVKTYVDTVAQGLDAKQSVLVATTANITLSGEQTIDGTLTSASRILVKNQSTASQNGIYVTAAGAWARAADADAWTELPGAYVFVEKGTINGDCGFVCTVDAGGTIGSTAVTFTQFSGAGTYTAGSGLTLTGTSFSVDGTITATLAGIQTVTGAKTFNDGKLILAGVTSGTTTLKSGAAAGSSVLTLPVATDTLVGKATADTFTNKTFDSAGTGNVLKVSGVTVSAGQFPAETTNGNATAGNIGEYVESVVAVGSEVTLTSATPADLTTITLNPGEWEVDLILQFDPAASTSVTVLIASISQTLNTRDSTTAGAENCQRFNAQVPGASNIMTVPVYRLRVKVTSGTLTLHGVAQGNFTVAGLKVYGILRARRPR